MKQIVITGFIALIIVGLLSAIVWGSKNKQPGSNGVQQEQKAVSSDVPTFFFGNTCPHCADVEAWLKSNNVEDKITIVKKEVYDNQKNAQEMTAAAQSCGLPTDSIGVPFLYVEGKCLVGSPDVISYLSEKAGIK